MKFLVGAVVFLAVLFGTVAAADKIKTEENVLVLTNNNFKRAINDYDYILVEFYGPWCVHCKALAPEYAKAATQLAKSKSEIKLGKVDATIEDELAEEYQIRGYPTLKFFRFGAPLDYSGGRQAADIIAWVIKKTGPPAITLDTIAEAEKFLADNEIAIIGFFQDVESAEAEIFIATADALDSFDFAIVSNVEIIAKYEVNDGAIILFKTFDEGKSIYEGEITLANLKKFVQVQSLPLIAEFNHESAPKIFSGSIESHLLFFVSKKEGHIEAHVDPLKDVAKQFRNEILFVIISSDDEDHARIFESFGMTKKEIPTIRLIRFEDDIVQYKPESRDLSPAVIRNFLQKFLDGKLKQYLITEDLADDWDKTPVKTLVASNFDEVAFDKSKDVLVEFYAPWCGHCKQLAPIYDELAEHYEENNAIVIAKIDATANELEHTKITSVPIIKLYRKGDNKIIDFNLERKLENFIKFLDAGGDIAAPTEELEAPASDEKSDKDEL